MRLVSSNLFYRFKLCCLKVVILVIIVLFNFLFLLTWFISIIETYYDYFICLQLSNELVCDLFTIDLINLNRSTKIRLN